MLNIILSNDTQSQGKRIMKKWVSPVSQELQSSFGVFHLVLELPVSWLRLIPNQFLAVLFSPCSFFPILPTVTLSEESLIKGTTALVPTCHFYWWFLGWNCQFQFSSVQFSLSVVSNSLRPHDSQHTRPPCPSPTPGAYSNSCPLSRWCHPAISSSVIPFTSCLPIFPSIRIFSNESVLCVRWPKYWSFSFSISLSNEYSGLISFRIDWLDLLAVQVTQESSQPTD